MPCFISSLFGLSAASDLSVTDSVCGSINSCHQELHNAIWSARTDCVHARPSVSDVLMKLDSKYNINLQLQDIKLHKCTLRQQTTTSCNQVVMLGRGHEHISPCLFHMWQQQNHIHSDTNISILHLYLGFLCLRPLVARSTGALVPLAQSIR